MICNKCFPFDVLFKLLRDNDTAFSVSLSDVLLKQGKTVEEYAMKLSELATVAYEKDENGTIKGIVVGYTDALPEDKGSYIAQVLTVPEFQKQGVCGRLLLEYCNYCSHKDISYVWLTTGAANYAAQAAYERVGFRKAPNSDTSLVLYKKYLQASI